MELAFWCVFIIVMLPYVLVLSSRLPTLTLKINLSPRLYADELQGVFQRLYWAHLNSLEAIAPFTAAVLIAQYMQVDQNTINTLAMAFVLFRVTHAVMYALNLGVMRSLTFFGSSCCLVLLFVNAGT